MPSSEGARPLKVFARISLTEDHLGAGEPALLLEGSWPAQQAGPNRWSLDDVIDSRFDWIDRVATRLADELTPVVELSVGSISPAGVSFLNSLRLRYHLVKLLRVSAFFSDRARLIPSVELLTERHRDDDYQVLLREVAGQLGIRLAISEFAVRHWRPERPPRRSLVRRVLGSLVTTRSRRLETEARTRIVLCGNPRLLDPVATELVERGCRIWWLNESLAVKQFLRWRFTGVEQLVCDSPAGSPRVSGNWPESKVIVHGVDLTTALRHWIDDQIRHHWPSQSRLVANVIRHFTAVQPHHVVLDQDASPLQRTAISVGRAWRAESTVIQHGIPAVPFGYAPLIADRFCAWDSASRQQLVRWDVPDERIVITGATNLATAPRKTGRFSTKSPTLLLLASTPPKDQRPDSVAFHLTSATHRAMVQSVGQAATTLAARLIVKPHPRDAKPDFKWLRQDFPELDLVVSRDADLPAHFSAAACVISCASTAGLEAKLAGLPVILLLPAGSADGLPIDLWNWDGVAHDALQLTKLLKSILAADYQPTRAIDVAHDARIAAEKICERIVPRGVASNLRGSIHIKGDNPLSVD